MLLWYGVIGLATAQTEWDFRKSEPNNADLAALKSNLANLVTNDFFKPNSRKVNKTLKKIIKKWDQKIVKRITKRGCLIDSPSFATSGAATCTQQAIELIDADFSSFLDAYIDPTANTRCFMLHASQQRKVEKLGRTLQKAAKHDRVTTDCPHGMALITYLFFKNMVFLIRIKWAKIVKKSQN